MFNDNAYVKITIYGNPQLDLMYLSYHFVLIDMPCWERSVLVTCHHYVSIFNQHWSIYEKQL